MFSRGKPPYLALRGRDGHRLREQPIRQIATPAGMTGCSCVLIHSAQAIVDENHSGYHYGRVQSSSPQQDEEVILLRCPSGGGSQRCALTLDLCFFRGVTSRLNGASLITGNAALLPLGAMRDALIGDLAKTAAPLIR